MESAIHRGGRSRLTPPTERTRQSGGAPRVVGSEIPGRRRRGWRVLAWVTMALLALGVIARVLLPGALRDYVNRTLDRNAAYDGKIGSIEMHLWRGAYAIHDLRISTTERGIHQPLFAAPRVDFAVEWRALFHGKLVGRVKADRPEVNFVDAAGEAEDQSGAGAPWLSMIRDLFPFHIESVIIDQGTIRFHTLRTAVPVEIHISDLNVAIEGLTNIRDETTPLVATIRASGMLMDQAQTELEMRLDPFAYRPTFELAARVLNLHVTLMNDLARAYGSLDFEDGWFDLVIEAEARNGSLSGYVKPLFRELKVFSLSEDLQDENPLVVFWQALVGAVTDVFKNQPRDQFGTLIPFSGDLSTSTSTDVLAVIGNVLRNAFVRAYLPQLEGSPDTAVGLQFAAPQINDTISLSDP